MIQSDLLRFKIDYKNDKIYPLLSSIENQSKEYEVASKIIEIFDKCYKEKLSKERLGLMIKELEYIYKDYKLIRGLYSLMEKRCIFAPIIEDTENDYGLINRNDIKYNDINRQVPSEGIKNLTPYEIRRRVFEESSQRNIAVSEINRQEILDAVAHKLQTTASILVKIMWSDLDENMIIMHYRNIDPPSLLVSYNVSSIQTLLFDCLRIKIKMNASESIGTIWKWVLRKVKKLGLMYWLEIDINSGSNNNNDLKSKIVCTIEGPLNVIKLTDRYGIAIAKIIPDIFQSEFWELNAEILRINSEGKKKLYVFEMNEKTNADKISPDIIKNFYNNANEKSILTPFNSKAIDLTSTKNQVDKFQKTQKSKRENIHLLSNVESNSPIYRFDSDIEKTFYQKFKSFDSSWKISREPEPIVTNQRTAFIPDFLLTRFKNKIIVEIIGFWTKDYLLRKISKITQTLDSKLDENFFMILIIDFDNLASYELDKQNKLSDIRNNDKVLIIPYKKNNIPFGEIISFLKMIDSKYITKYWNENARKFNIEDKLDDMLENFKNSKDLMLTIGQLNKAVIYDDKENQSNEYLDIKEILKDNKDFKTHIEEKLESNGMVIIKDHIFKQGFFKELFISLQNAKFLREATELLNSKGIEEEIHIDILQKIGFEIEWNGLDYSNAAIKYNKN